MPRPDPAPRSARPPGRDPAPSAPPPDVPPLAALDGLATAPWWRAATALDAVRGRGATAAGPAAPGDGGEPDAARLAGALIDLGAADPADAAARALAWGEDAAHRALLDGRDAPGLRAWLRRDLAVVAGVVSRLAERPPSAGEPPLARLAPPARELDDLRGPLLENDAAALLAALVARVARHGAGPLARARAFRWDGRELRPVEAPAPAELDDLVGLEPQLRALEANVAAFLAGRPALPTLLHGPRGSGKSTAVRALLARFGAQGLRLVETPAELLPTLPALEARLRRGRHRYVLYIDDLAFEAGDAGYRPLKTLLEGGLAARPAHVLPIATSNRRRLVRERFSDRPDPLDDDPARWDTQHERLALADRFGLRLAFPETPRERYLTIARTLLERAGRPWDEETERKALLFAERGNGWSGRTAKQFSEVAGELA